MTGPIFDTHAHYSARAFDADRFALLDSLPEKGVVGVCEQATHSGDAPRVLELAHRYPWVYAAIGIHPESLLAPEDCGEEGPAPTVSVFGGDWAAEMKALAPYYDDPKVVAVGECGLDYHWPVPKDAQLALFEAEIRLALELDKPIIVHDRNAHADVYALLKKYRPKGIVHCYSGSADDAVWLARQGLYFGFGGACTFKGAKRAAKAIAALPLEQIVLSLIWQLRIFSNKDELLHFHRGIFRLKRKIVFDSLAIGMSPFLMNMAACFIVILINQGLKKYGGDLAIGAFGIVNRLVFIIVMIVMGLNQGMQPIAGYNFGAGQHARVIKTLKLTIIYATCVTTFGFIVGMLFSDWVVSIFTSDAELIALSAKGLRIVVMFFPIIGFQMVTANFFQSIGMASKAIFLSLTRQMMVLLPCLIILPRFFGVAGVWYSMPISDLLASLIAGTMLVWQLRKFKAQA